MVDFPHPECPTNPIFDPFAIFRLSLSKT